MRTRTITKELPTTKDVKPAQGLPALRRPPKWYYKFEGFAGTSMEVTANLLPGSDCDLIRNDFYLARDILLGSPVEHHVLCLKYACVLVRCTPDGAEEVAEYLKKHLPSTHFVARYSHHPQLSIHRR